MVPSYWSKIQETQFYSIIQLLMETKLDIHKYSNKEILISLSPEQYVCVLQ